MEGSTQKCKIVLLGDQSVGKTSIINRFIFDNFTGNQQPTVGVDFVSKTVGVENRNLRMQLWDTAGQQRFHSLIPSYIKDCNAAIIVFDLTNNLSFQNINNWIDKVRQVRGQQALILIIGNKSDLEQQRQVNKTQAQNKIKDIGCRYMEVSAKSGQNIKQFFKDLAYIIAGGDTKSKQQSTTKGPSNNQTAPQQQNNNNNNFNLNAKNYNQKGQSKKNSKGCC